MRKGEETPAKRRRVAASATAMQWLSPERQSSLADPAVFPPTHANVLESLTELTLSQTGVPPEEIERALAEIRRTRRTIDWKSVESIFSTAGDISNRICGRYPPEHPFSFVQTFVLPQNANGDMLTDRAVSSSLNIANRHAGDVENDAQEARDCQAIHHQFADVTAATDHVSRLIVSGPNAYPRTSPVHVCALVDALLKAQRVITQTSAESSAALMARTSTRTGISEATQVVYIDPVPVDQTYLRDFWRAPIPGHPLEAPCLRGKDCFVAHSTLGTCFRCFYPPTAWDEIVRADEPPTVRTMCNICSLMIAHITRGNCMRAGIKYPPIQIADYRFKVGDGPNEFHPSYLIQKLGYGLFAPFLDVSKTYFVTCRRRVVYGGNAFLLPAFELANFQ